jgi:hypothetical protein
MAWSQFEYAVDVFVKIHRHGSRTCNDTVVRIRPASTAYDTEITEDGDLVIRIPYDENGRRLSVEFADDLYEFRSDGQDYVTSGGHVVGNEPVHGLLLFASPFQPPHLDYATLYGDADVHMMEAGPIHNGGWGESRVLVFPPGVYWMDQDHEGTNGKLGQMHIRLHPNTCWVHFCPGAYVKGAIEYTSAAEKLYATGHGVLSGEHYVYQANPQTYYQALKSDQHSVRMWWHNSCCSSQTWTCVGPTVASPPFNSMDFHGEPQVHISDYKQVGAFFFQTDGPQVYPGSTVNNVFYHVNDDAIKVYHSNVQISNVTVWKCHNDPVIQLGWAPRNVSCAVIDGLHIIHTRYYRSDMYVPSAIIGASPSYDGCASCRPHQQVELKISNVTIEGPCPSLVRLSPLQSFALEISRITCPDGIITHEIGVSKVHASDGVKMALNISDWTVAGEKVSMDTFHSDKLGRFDIDVSYWGHWRIA